MYKSKKQTQLKSAAEALGWISLGIGAAELLMPRALERMIGIANGQNTGVLRVLGAREVLHGIDLLAHEAPAAGVKARLAGDVLDSALLSAAAVRSRRPWGVLAAFALVLPVVALDVWLWRELQKA